MNRTILHIDFDSFFASCEQFFNPNLRGKPIGVTAANGRTAIIAASKEAKKLGVKSPSTTWAAREICPEIEFVKADFDRYLHITKKFIDICSTYSPYVEVFSLDEVFIDMTPTMHLFKTDVVGLSERIKKQLASEISPVTTVSVGASYNKLLAKLASGLNKPDGITLITPENRDSIYKNTKLTDICGIGERLKLRLNMLGVYSLLELRTYPSHLLRKEFGKVYSQLLLQYAWGEDSSSVRSLLEEDADPKSVGRNYCLPENTYDQKKVHAILSELCEEVARRLRVIHKKGRTIHLYLGGERSMHGSKTIYAYTNTGKDLFEGVKFFLKEWKWDHMVRQIHISVSNLIDEKYSTVGLFEDPREKILEKVADNLNDKFGPKAVRKGYVMHTPRLKTVPNGFFGDKAFYSSYLKG